MAQEAVIRVEEVSIAYGENVILRDISFEVKEGEIFAIVGGSGCGKSTLLKAIIGLVPVRTGRIFLRDTDVVNGSEEEVRRELVNVGVLFQSGALIGSLTLAENIALPILRHKRLPLSFVENLIKVKLGLVNLTGYENHLPSELSGGMKKRAGLARALALDPQILFFDEPTAGLDPITSEEIYQLIRSLNESLGTTMVIVTHDISMVLEIVHRVIMLDGTERRVIAEGFPDKLCRNCSDPRVRKFFRKGLY
ncbi:MAG: ATP-binding cassette domain-containing protein [Syntrophales bacterium]|nr:ATP-binding cassette domain-containing protein [Syntrophales bacterium]